MFLVFVGLFNRSWLVFLLAFAAAADFLYVLDFPGGCRFGLFASRDAFAELNRAFDRTVRSRSTNFVEFLYLLLDLNVDMVIIRIGGRTVT